MQLERAGRKNGKGGQGLTGTILSGDVHTALHKETDTPASPFFLNIALLTISFLLLLLAASQNSEASLKPEEVLVLVNSRSDDSVRIGKLYIKLRNLPEENLVKIDVPHRKNIQRREYDRRIVLPLKAVIAERQKSGRDIRCIVTTYGVPMIIGAQRPGNYSEKLLVKYKKMLSEKEQKLSYIEEEIRIGNKQADSKKGKKRVDTLKARRKKLKPEVDRLRRHLKKLNGSDGAAALDSELAMLSSTPYEISGWQPNPDALYYKGKMKKAGPALMISRLDAPTPELAEKLIRTSLEVERAGLSGKIYLDARGLNGEGPYAKYDKDIRNAARILEHSALPVILDNRNELFGPGSAPRAALYCGWYSLGKYVDGLEWVKGAVGYHVASIEASSIHDPKSTQWVKNMLERGVVATVGPVAEPYLSAFPSPSLFFPLLLSGKYTLAEVFAFSNPFLSWRMILIGDPLYNPFKHSPSFDLNKSQKPS